MARIEEDSADLLWGRCVASLEKSLPADDMDMWIRPLQPERIEGGLLLYAANVFVAEEVKARFLPLVMAALPPSMQVALRIGSRPKRLDEMPAADDDEPVLPISPKSASRAPSKATRVSEPGELPFIWGDASRAIPSSLVRCALFTVNQYGLDAERPKREHTRISSQRNLTVYVTGEETNIFDRDVLMQLLQYQRRFKVGDRFSFSARQVLGDLGLEGNGRNITRLLNAITRLRRTYLELHERDPRGGAGKFGEFNLVSEFFRDESLAANKQNWVVSFNQTVADMMGRNELTRLIWEQSQAIDMQLAKGLHGYYASHNPPYAVTVSFLREITGSNIKQLFKFRAQLKQALQELVKVGFLDSWAYHEDGDLVSVKRSALKLDRDAG